MSEVKSAEGGKSWEEGFVVGKGGVETEVVRGEREVCDGDVVDVCPGAHCSEEVEGCGGYDLP